MANHTTHTTSAQPEKKSRVNQSIKAVTVRLRVGSAKAANAASAGRPSSSERSLDAVSTVVTSATPRNHRGNARCGLRHTWRQRQTVHTASGAAGQPNHNSRRAMPLRC